MNVVICYSITLFLLLDGQLIHKSLKSKIPGELTGAKMVMSFLMEASTTETVLADL
jgi:hypothetical protein